MSNVNSVVVSGNATRDPEVKWMAEDGASAIVSLGVAVNRSRKNQEGEYIDEVSFFNVDVFGGFALLVAKKLKKGDSITVAGRLEEQKFEKDGQERSVVKIVAQQIDSDGFFRLKEEDAAVAVGSTASEPTAVAAAAPAPARESAEAKPDPQQDDIPF